MPGGDGQGLPSEGGPFHSNFVGRYARGENKVRVETVPDGGQVNRVFEQAGVPYGPCLELGSKACGEATKKRKSDAGVGPSGKRAKVSGRKAIPAKASVAPRGTSAAPSKTVMAKATHATQASKTSVAPGTTVPPKVGAPSGTTMSKIVAATVTASRVGLLKISTSAKRPAAALSPAVKGT
jgi:hypothetical protein